MQSPVKKRLYLFLALLLPGLLFVFLKYQASNRFDIPIYYEEGVPEQTSNCPIPVSGPYHVADSVWSHLRDGKQDANVIIFSSKGLDGSDIARSISDEIGAGVSFTIGSELSTDSLMVARWMNCTFLMTPFRQTVLLDNRGRIRGYYDLGLRDEVDRLRVELKILLERY